MSERIVDRKKAIELVREIAASYIRKNGKPPGILIAVGGTAMALHGVRDESEDVDLYVSVREMESIATEIEASSGYRIDVTSKTNLWGRIDVWDIESDAVMMENMEIEGYYVDLAAISPETLFIVKASSMREKDRNDLSVVLPLTSPEKIMERFASLWTRQDFFVRDESLVNILSKK